MDENLQRLSDALREEKCPRRVLEKVASRIARRPRSFQRFRFRILGFAVCLATLLAFITVWHWPNQGHRDPAQPVVRSQADNVRVAEEAGAALAYIGSVLLEVGEHTETILLNEAVPPLRSGFETASETIKNRM